MLISAVKLELQLFSHLDRAAANNAQVEAIS